jgi:hypothetical protein
MRSCAHVAQRANAYAPHVHRQRAASTMRHERGMARTALTCVRRPLRFSPPAPLQYHGFPFNLGISHPQYIGSALTVWGLVALLWAPEVRPALVPVAASWTGLYVATGIMESKF